MLDPQAEQHDRGQSCADLYDAVLELKRRHDLHPCAVQPRDGLSLRRDSERDLVLDLVKRFRDMPSEQRQRLPALLNSLAQLEIVIGDLETAQRDFQEVARLVDDALSRAEAHHNVFRAALERRDWNEALAALRRAVALDREAFEPFPFDRFEPERILGAGGFGVSFLCRQRCNGQAVVIKALRNDSLERDIDALFGEMGNIQDLDHPALVRIHECGYGGERSRPFLVMEHVRGQTLAEHVAGHGPLTPEDWFCLAWPMARALQALHDRGILHRSLRPAAVMVCPVADASGSLPWRVKLLDAGLSLKRTLIHSCASNPEACTRTTLGRSVARTIAFAPIEVIARPKGQVWIGPHSDVYSFGKVSAFALSGRADPILWPEEWRQLLSDCTAWTQPARTEHFGVVLEQLTLLPDADQRIPRLASDLHEISIAEHSAALQLDPKRALDLIQRGNAYARNDQFDKAIDDYTAALQLQPDDASLYRRRGLAQSMRQAFDDAIADFTQALRLEPRNVESLANRGLAYAGKNDRDRAIADFNEALRLQPRDALLLFHRGNAYLGNDDYAPALADFTEVIRLDPRNPWAFGNRGKIHARRGDHRRALTDFTRLLQLDPNNLHALRDRAAAASALHQHDSAIRDYTTALEIEEHPAWYNDRGREHVALGDVEAALADFNAAIELAPEFAGAYLSRGDLHGQRGDLAAALVDYSAALRLHPGDAVLHHKRARIHVLMGNYQEAITDNLEVLHLDPEDAGACNNLAWLWATHPQPQQRDLARAIDFARQACERTRWQHAGFLDTLAVAHAAAGRFAEAIEQQRRAIDLAEEENKAEYRVRLALYEAGQPYDPSKERG